MKTLPGAGGEAGVHARPACAAEPHGARVLVVEDEPTIARTLADDLTDHGYRVTLAGNGAEAICLVAEHDYAAVITDLRLPGADGVEVLRAAKGRSASTTVLVISAHAASRQQEVCGLGADGVLGKPFLNECVLDWLRARL
jgi:two-component system response regulator BaeR